MQPLDILVCNSANKPSFQNPTKSLFVQCSIDALSVYSYLTRYPYWHTGPSRLFALLLAGKLRDFGQHDDQLIL